MCMGSAMEEILELPEEMKNSIADGLLHEADGSLHYLPGSFEGFVSAGI